MTRNFITLFVFLIFFVIFLNILLIDTFQVIIYLIKLRNKFTYDFGLERWLHLSVFYAIPVDSSIESVTSDVFFPSSSAAKPLGGVLHKELERYNLCENQH